MGHLSSSTSQGSQHWPVLHSTRYSIVHKTWTSMGKGSTEKQPWETVADLESQRLSRDEIYNIWCDRAASTAWLKGNPSLPDPDLSMEEKWAVYSMYPSFYKINDNLDDSVYSSMGCSQLLEYIQWKHGLQEAKMERVNILVLQGCLTKLKFHKRASIVKLIHDWIPTYATLCHQDREPCPLCPHCKSTIETSSHVITCPNHDARYA